MGNDGPASNGTKEVGREVLEGRCGGHVPGSDAVDAGSADVTLRVDEC